MQSLEMDGTGGKMIHRDGWMGRDLLGMAVPWFGLDAALSASLGWEKISVFKGKNQDAKVFLLLFLFYCSG